MRTKTVSENILHEGVLVGNDTAGIDNPLLVLLDDRVGSVLLVGDDDRLLDVNGNGAGDEGKGAENETEELHFAIDFGYWDGYKVWRHVVGQTDDEWADGFP